MTTRLRSPIWTLATVPYLLLSSSQQAGIVTRVHSDGSGERLVYARGAAGRVPEINKYLGAAFPGSDWNHVGAESWDRVLAWRDGQVANLATVGDKVEVQTLGIVEAPLSFRTRHIWKETLTFDRGAATDVEVHGQSLAQFHYVVYMPGKITSSSPAGKTEGGKVEWTVGGGPAPQTFSVEAETIRWPYIAIWVYVLLFLVAKAAVYGPRVAKRIRRKPRRI